MKKQTSPFKFLDAYQQGDKDVFFGRTQETNDLYNALSGVKHLLVYGPSGAGKTSLIECGLRNQFSNVDWFARTIRRGDNMVASVFANINDALDDKIELDAKTGLPTDKKVGFRQAVRYLFEERFQPVYLLFDQFEELLILGTETEKETFFIQLNQLIRYRVPCRVLLIMREEFIGHLSEFEHLIPSIFKYRFRLEKMGRSNVREVVFKMLESPKYQSFFEVENSEQLADSILAKLPDAKREIELTHVQVFLEELWNRAHQNLTKNAIPTLHKNLIKKEDNLTGVLDSFLKKQLEELDSIHGKNMALEVLAAMISERHTKLQLSAADIQQDLNNKGIILQQTLIGILQDLEKHSIIRPLKAGGQTRYEISHDLLASVVGQNLTEEMKMREKATDIYKVYEERQGDFSTADLDYMRPFQLYKAYPISLEKRIKNSQQKIKAEQLKEQKRLEAEKEQLLENQRLLEDKQRRQRWFIVFLSIAALVFIGLASYAYLAKSKAEQESFRAKMLAADGLKKEGKYPQALNMLDKAANDNYSSEQLNTITQKRDTFLQVFNKMRLVDSLLVDTNYRMALPEIEGIQALSNDGFISEKSRIMRQDRTKALESLKNDIKIESNLAKPSVASLKKAIGLYRTAQKYSLENESLSAQRKQIVHAIEAYKLYKPGVLDAVIEEFLEAQ